MNEWLKNVIFVEEEGHGEDELHQIWCCSITAYLLKWCSWSLGCTWRYIHIAKHNYKSYQSVQCIYPGGQRPILLMHMKTATLWGYQIAQSSLVRSSQSTCRPSNSKVWNWPCQAYVQIEYPNCTGLSIVTPNNLSSFFLGIPSISHRGGFLVFLLLPFQRSSWNLMSSCCVPRV